MEPTTKTSVKQIVISSDLDVVVARLRAREVAREIGFGTVDQARISLAAGELARTLANHLNQHGEIIISGINTEGHIGIQVISVHGQQEEPGRQSGEANGQEQKFSKVFALVDEGVVETEGTQGTRVTLMKWLT